MQTFLSEDFLLDTPAARTLYHEDLRDVPIFDYHCHLSPRELYENRPPEDIAALWLSGDHYKWRVMRACGVPERQITGDAPGEEKFVAFARTLERAVGNPVYHWAHLELQTYFGIREPLKGSSAARIYREANRKMQEGDFRPQALVKASHVSALITTDDPADSLCFHEKLRASSFGAGVLPAFRPDKALLPGDPGFRTYLTALGRAADVEIGNFAALTQALERRMDVFAAHGCRVSDHSFYALPWAPAAEGDVERIFARALAGQPVSLEDQARYQTALMLFLGRAYAARGWVMELHLGAMRNNNTRMFRCLGADTGFDSIGDAPVAAALSRFLDALDREASLPKTVLFNLNPKDTFPLAAMLGNFQQEGIPGKLQYGPAWWFLDSIDGMTEHLKALGNLGVLGTFIGMETDSRSFTSYPRHAYFRRVLCRLLGRWAEDGLIDPDPELLRGLVQDIAFGNAAAYFQWNEETKKTGGAL